MSEKLIVQLGKEVPDKKKADVKLKVKGDSINFKVDDTPVEVDVELNVSDICNMVTKIIKTKKNKE